jgi:hypothetical protein
LRNFRDFVRNRAEGPAAPHARNRPEKAWLWHRCGRYENVGENTMKIFISTLAGALVAASAALAQPAPAGDASKDCKVGDTTCSSQKEIKKQGATPMDGNSNKSGSESSGMGGAGTGGAGAGSGTGGAGTGTGGAGGAGSGGAGGSGGTGGGNNP